MMIKSSKRHIKTRLVKAYITVITTNRTSLLQVPHGNLTMGPGFIFMSHESINSKLMQMLWFKFYFFELEALWQKFDCHFELIKAELTQRCLLANLDIELFLKSVSRKDNFHCIDGSKTQ